MRKRNSIQCSLGGQMGTLGESGVRASVGSCGCASGMYKYGSHLTPGLTEVRSYAAFLTSLLAEGLRVRFRGVPALKTS